MLKRFTRRLLLGLCLISAPHAEPIDVQIINSARQSVGLPALNYSKPLLDAAHAHAFYLSKHLSFKNSSLISAHAQNPNKKEFIGAQAPQRVQYFRYPHTQVSENISLGNASTRDSIDGLMAAIYHRFTFLNFDADEIGAARVTNRYVYNLGIRDLRQACINMPIEAAPRDLAPCTKPSCQTPDTSEYYSVCTNGFHINVPFYNRLKLNRLAKKPLAVIWPPDGADQISPVFYEETPHPTPDLSMSGYPISLQINPSKAQQVGIISFTLERYAPLAKRWMLVEDIRHIDHENDRNQQFSKWQFAWFPLQRLDWASQYRYQIIALIDNTVHQWRMAFKTASLPAPMINVLNNLENIQMHTDHVVLYRPDDGYDAFPFKKVDLRFDTKLRVKTNVIDANTLEIKASGNNCTPIYVTTRLGEEMVIRRCGQ